MANTPWWERLWGRKRQSLQCDRCGKEVASAGPCSRCLEDQAKLLEALAEPARRIETGPCPCGAMVHATHASDGERTRPADPPENGAHTVCGACGRFLWREEAAWRVATGGEFAGLDPQLQRQVAQDAARILGPKLYAGEPPPADLPFPLRRVRALLMFVSDSAGQPLGKASLN